MEKEGGLGTGIFRIDAQGKKRFCCGAAKRLKDKCLRFHQDEEMCVEFIKGKLIEMQAIRNVWQSSENSKVINFK